MIYGFVCFVKPGKQVQWFCRHAAAAPAQRLAGMQTIRPSSLLSLALPRGRMVQQRRTPFPSTAGGGGRVVAELAAKWNGSDGERNKSCPASGLTKHELWWNYMEMSRDDNTIQQPSVVIRIVSFKQDANKERGSVSDVLIPARPSSHIVFFFTLSSHIWLEHAYISQCVLRCHCESDCNTTYYAIAVS